MPSKKRTKKQPKITDHTHPDYDWAAYASEMLAERGADLLRELSDEHVATLALYFSPTEVKLGPTSLRVRGIDCTDVAVRCLPGEPGLDKVYSPLELVADVGLRVVPWTGPRRASLGARSQATIDGLGLRPLAV